jgi:hypothetical protein
MPVDWPPGALRFSPTNSATMTIAQLQAAPEHVARGNRRYDAAKTLHVQDLAVNQMDWTLSSVALNPSQLSP